MRGRYARMYAGMYAGMYACKCLSVWLAGCLAVRLSGCPSVWLSVCLAVRLSVCVFVQSRSLAQYSQCLCYNELCLVYIVERTDAYPRLAKRRPLGSLVSFPVLFSIFSQIALQVTTLVAAYYYLLGETWCAQL